MREEDRRGKRERERRSDSRCESSRQATGPCRDLVQAATPDPINHPAGTRAPLPQQQQQQLLVPSGDKKGPLFISLLS